MSAAPGVPFNDPRVIKEFNTQERNDLSGYLVLIVLSLISIGFSISYAYLGSTGIHFPSWGGPFLITMGSLGLLASLITFLTFLCHKIKVAPANSHKEEKKLESLEHTLRLTALALSFLGLVASASYIYLGSQGSHFPSWGSNYLITMGALGSASVLGLLAFIIFVQRKEIKISAWNRISMQVRAEPSNSSHV